jgi:hypothetical protein
MEGVLTSNEVGLAPRGCYDVLLISWLRVALTRYGKLIQCPSTFPVPFWHKWRMRKCYWEHSEFMVMVKQGDTWYSLNKRPEHLPAHPDDPPPARPLLPPFDAENPDEALILEATAPHTSPWPKPKLPPLSLLPPVDPDSTAESEVLDELNTAQIHHNPEE